MTSARPGSLLEGLEQEQNPAARESGKAPFVGPLDTRNIVLLVAGIATLIVAAVLIMRAVSSVSNGAGAVSRQRVAVDSETGKVFTSYKIKDGDTWPWEHPSTGKRTLYPAETCYWTRDGEATLEPTYVLLNEISGKEGPTYCPDCGRQVVAHNPMPPTELLIRAGERLQRGGK